MITGVRHKIGKRCKKLSDLLQLSGNIENNECLFLNLKKNISGLK